MPRAGESQKDTPSLTWQDFGLGEREVSAPVVRPGAPLAPISVTRGTCEYKCVREKSRDLLTLEERSSVNSYLK